MKVIYKSSMVDKINAEIFYSKVGGKEIDKIILTPDEWEDFRKELQLLCTYTVPYFPDEPYKLGGAKAEFRGIPIFVNEENEK